MKGRGKTRGFVLSLLVVTVMVLTVGVAGAATYTWNFSTPLGDVGSSVYTYFDTTSAYSITASAFTGVGSVNTAGPGGTWNLPAGGISTTTHLLSTSTGLGIAPAPPDINVGQLIQLDLNNLISNGFTNEVKIITGFNAGETVKIYGSNTAAGAGGTNVNGTLLGSYTSSGTSNYAFTFATIDYRYEWITVSSGGVLLGNGLTADAAGTSVPEPSTLLLLGSGLLGLVGYGRKRMKK